MPEKIYADCSRCKLERMCVENKWDLCHWRPSDLIMWSNDYVQDILIDGHPKKIKNKEVAEAHPLEKAGDALGIQKKSVYGE